ncbi:MAG: hypothetical protein QOE61_4646 [Micromonosporaceae bacterium]|nr:hypothetical protein [Micromonosporaceae bacterium]
MELHDATQRHAVTNRPYFFAGSKQASGPGEGSLEKLREIGPGLGYPHTSHVQESDRIRELRPRQGRCPWRAFYRDVDGVIVVAAVGPEASVDHRGFDRAVRSAAERLAEIEEGDDDG